MQKEEIINLLREQGCRITKQRRILLDIILEEECHCCKEIYYKAVKKDKTIGTATVYRMINTLEDIGAISRNTMYKISCNEDCGDCKECKVELSDGSTLEFSNEQWNQIVESGLKKCGYTSTQRVTNVLLESY